VCTRNPTAEDPATPFNQRRDGGGARFETLNVQIEFDELHKMLNILTLV
jgi:hypothetical protein